MGFYILNFTDAIVRLTEDALSQEVFELMLIACNQDRLLTCIRTREDTVVKGDILEAMLEFQKSDTKKKECALKRKCKNTKK